MIPEIPILPAFMYGLLQAEYTTFILYFMQWLLVSIIFVALCIKRNNMKTSKKTRINTKQSNSAEPKKKISKFGKMRGSYAGKIEEVGNVWDL